MSTIRKAASVLLVSESRSGHEILLVKRRGRAGLLDDAWVFPGGVMEKQDQDLFATAIRELSEEVGVEVNRSDLQPWSLWLTPSFEPKRYSAQFYLTVCKKKPAIWASRDELIEHRWVPMCFDVSAFNLPPPQLWLLHELMREKDCAKVIGDESRRSWSERVILPRAKDALPEAGAVTENLTLLFPWHREYETRGVGDSEPWQDKPIQRPSAVHWSNNTWRLIDE